MKISDEIRHFIHQQIFASLEAHQKLLYYLSLGLTLFRFIAIHNVHIQLHF